MGAQCGIARAQRGHRQQVAGAEGGQLAGAAGVELTDVAPVAGGHRCEPAWLREAPRAVGG
eukprot:3583166-Lingulodinium_polyedra.AAC.1